MKALVNENSIISDIMVDNETVKRLISKLSNNSAMGPDGIPIHV